MKSLEENAKYMYINRLEGCPQLNRFELFSSSIALSSAHVTCLRRIFSRTTCCTTRASLHIYAFWLVLISSFGRAISTRRNELLRQMYHMIRRRNNVGSVLALDEVDEEDLQSFLQRFDIAKECVAAHSFVKLILNVCALAQIQGASPT